MKRKNYFIAVLASIFLYTGAIYGQSNGNVYWHIDPSVKSCSMVIDPSLTQDQWKKYTRQVGEISAFKSMASAEGIGRNHFSIGMDYSITPIDQHDLAWINTFTHPDENCPLGDQIIMPTLRVKYGLNDKIDVGGLWITAPDANYGIIGGELKYAFLAETKNAPALAARVSYISLTGVSDYNLSLTSLDLLASKKVTFLTPYLGIKESLATGTETTNKVDLKKEHLLVTQGFFGLTYSIWMINLAVEYNLSDVNTFTFLVAFQSFKNR